MRSRKGIFTLESGRVIEANSGIFGISVEKGDERNLYGGYDQEIDEEFLEEEGPLTPAERQEISDFMIELWKKWAEPA